MAEPAHTRMTIDESFAWQEGQAELYELEDGQPLEMRAEIGRAHV